LALGNQVDPEVKIGVGMIVGNLARSDSHCTALLEEGVLELVKQFLGIADGRIQHLGLGAIRNLSVPPQNRKLIADSGVITSCAKVLESRNAHVLFLNMGVLRTLILQSAATATAFMEAEGVEKLMIFFSQDLADEHLRIRYEAGRVLAALFVSLPAFESVSSLMTQGGLKGPIFLVQSTYAILQQEGMRALQTLVQTEIHQQGILEAEGATEALVKLLDKEKDNELLTMLVRVVKKLTEKEGGAGREAFKKIETTATKLTELSNQTTDGALKALIQTTITQLS
jgi:hypothetical protein